MNNYLFSILPLWVVYVIAILIIIISIRAGITFARWRIKYHMSDNDSAVNTMVGATLGLLTFILAFTFSSSSSRFDSRKQFLLDEVNAIETSWLRAGLMEQPYSDKLQRALVEYTEVRFWHIENPDKPMETIAKSEKIQNQIWSLITEMNSQNVGKDEINAILIEAVNDMFDLQTKRISKGIIDHIPDLIWIALYSLIILAMFEVGYLMGKSDKSNWALILALAMSFSVILIIIVDLDSYKGFTALNQQAMYDMYDRIK